MKHLAAYILLAPLVCYSHNLAVSSGSPWWTHLTYMFGHAGWLHYALNGAAWLMMRKIATRERTLAAIVTAALIPATDVPVLGWSVVLYYYLGLCLANMSMGAKMRLLGIVAVGFFIPWIAAGHHATMLAAGWLMRKMERRWERTLH